MIIALAFMAARVERERLERLSVHQVPNWFAEPPVIHPLGVSGGRRIKNPLDGRDEIMLRCNNQKCEAFNQ